MTSRKSYFVCAAAITLSFGCGAAEDLGESIDTTSEAVTFAPAHTDPEGELGYWYAAPLSPKYMQPTATHVCFLSAVTGSFLSANDAVWITPIPGINMWALNGSRGTGFPKARSYCVQATPAPLANPYEANKYDPNLYQWVKGQPGGDTDLGPTAGRTCFLTHVKGRMDSASNWVRTHKDGGSWKLGGGNSDVADGMAASARCINRSQFPGDNYEWDSAQGGFVPLPIINGQWYLFSVSTSGPACFLTRAGGSFLTESAHVISYREQVHTSGYNWKLNGSSGGGTRTATARCLF